MLTIQSWVGLKTLALNAKESFKLSALEFNADNEN